MDSDENKINEKENEFKINKKPIHNKPNINQYNNYGSVNNTISRKINYLNERKNFENDEKNIENEDEVQNDNEEKNNVRTNNVSTNEKGDFKSNPLKTFVKTNEETKKEFVRKQIIKFIIKNPWVLVIILGVVIVLFMLLFFLAGNADSDSGSLSLSNSDYCSDFPMKSTTLSESEFIQKLEKNLIAQYGNNNATNAFVNNASIIYKIATKNGINPELVVVRAISEGFTPGGSTYNYWGLAVYNGQNSGASYSSFSDGVLAFVKNVSVYDTVLNMMSKYAYIGDYWANAGSNSLGGCQFINYTKDFYDNKSRAEEVLNVCAKNNCPYSVSSGTAKVDNPSKCLKTNEEDQMAYARYNSSQMGKIRTKIFEVEPNSCEIENNGNNVDIANINDIRALGSLIVEKAIKTFDSYEYSQAKRNNVGYVDCSSMVDRAYRQVGIDYLYTTWGNAGTTVTESDWCRKNGAVVNSTNVNDFLPGDLIFNNNFGHVVLYAGNGQIFEASGHYPDNPSQDVRLTNYYSGTVMVCRPLRVYFRNKGISINE